MGMPEEARPGPCWTRACWFSPDQGVSSRHFLPHVPGSLRGKVAPPRPLRAGRASNNESCGSLALRFSWMLQAPTRCPRLTGRQSTTTIGACWVAKKQGPSCYGDAGCWWPRARSGRLRVAGRWARATSHWVAFPKGWLARLERAARTRRQPMGPSLPQHRDRRAQRTMGSSRPSRWVVQGEPANPGRYSADRVSALGFPATTRSRALPAGRRASFSATSGRGLRTN